MKREYKPLGLYVHIPFCKSKCIYCDFYSLPGGEEKMDRYVSVLCRQLAEIAPRTAAHEVDTVYFGGGTPSWLGEKRLRQILKTVEKHYRLTKKPEITLECNPDSAGDWKVLRALRRAGFNRLSMGLQSANGEELRLLGRAHSPQDVRRAVEAARAGGFGNLSLDLMLGLPDSSEETLGQSIAFAAELEPEHISAYLLKIEPGTDFAARDLALPNEDQEADQYLFCVRELEARGYGQYEISNFAQPGRESRHNLLYWRDEEYLGLGPAAHSFYEGRRFYWPRDLTGFLAGSQPVEDGPGGSLEEYAMLALRLREGLRRQGLRERFGERGEEAFQKVLANGARCPARLLRRLPEALALTPEGFLASNAVTARLLEGL